MTGLAAWARLLWVVAAIGFAQLARAHDADVPYVPTSWSVVDAMLRLAKVGPDDYLIDLGSGDGRIVIAAAKQYGTRGFGVDIDGALVGKARREAQRQGVGDKVAFHTGNLYVTDISRATVVTMYLFPQVNMQLRPRLLRELRPGTRIVSHEFDMANWQPDERITLAVPDKPYGAPSSDVFLWIVPADASGRWQLTLPDASRDYVLELEQTFQMIEGALRAGGSARFAGGRMRGESIGFTLVMDRDGREARHAFSGRVAGDTMSGTVSAAAGQREWRAVRTARGKLNIDAQAPSRVATAEERK